MPRLRPGLRFTPVGEHNQAHYIVEDTARHVYYRIGLEEYLLLAHLNRSSSLEELLQKAAATSDVALAPEQAMTVLKWAAAKQLLQTDSPKTLNALLGQEKQLQAMRALNRMNLVSFKIPLGNPDPLLQKISPWLRPLTGPFFGLLWIVAALFAMGTLFSHWQEFHAGSTGFFSPTNLFLLWLIWLGLKILHELFHALVCYRYGGRVHEAGILFILFMPFTYVNATSSWKFPSRWQRIHVAIAGMFIELAVAWTALIIWAKNPDTTAGLIAHRTVIVAGISSLLFNANPLMRFDGYYILSDLVDIPNLYQLGLQSTKELWARLLLNIKAPSVITSAQQAHWLFIRIYGVLVFLWRILIFASLGYMASKLFGGLGTLISLLAVLVWISSPIHDFIARLPAYREQNPQVLRNLLLRTSIMICLSTILLATVGWKRSIRAPAVVEYEQQYRVKAGAGGFVSTILVKDGDRISAGQKLMILEDPDRVATLHVAELELQQTRVKIRIAYNRGQLPAMQILRQQEKALITKLKQQQDEFAALTVTAPGSGTVIAEGLDQLMGTYMKKGNEILWIVNPEQKQMVASVAQDDIDQMRDLVGKNVTIDMRDSGLGLFTGRVKRITPTASTELTHPGLAAKYGGSIDVLQKTVGRKDSSMREQIQFEFFEPRFSMEITVPGEFVRRLWSGQLAYVLARGPRITLRRKIHDIFSTWVSNKDRAAAIKTR